MSFDQSKYITEYQRQNYDTVTIRIPKGVKEEWKSYAAGHGLTLVELIRRSVDNFMEEKK